MITSKAKSRHRRPKPARPKSKGAPRSPAVRQPAQKLPLSYSPTDEDITPDVMEFIEAINLYKREHNRPFPTWSEVLKILKGMGYRR
jgi:hypothetical protein